MHGVEQLALVFMQAFNLHIEEAVRIHRFADARPDKLGQAHLVLVFDGSKLFLELLVFSVCFQAL